MKKIMVVEDDSIVRLDIVEMLENANYSIVSAVGNGEKAIEYCEQKNPDLIIMDIKMPKLNGLKASRIISKKSDVPILILTAYSQSEFVDQAKESNIVGYIVKPVSESQLLPAVEIALNQAKRLNGLKQETQTAYKKIEERKVTEKAKGILMKELNLDESEAYRKMRTLSMNKQMAIEKIAQKIITQFSGN